MYVESGMCFPPHTQLSKNVGIRQKLLNFTKKMHRLGLKSNNRADV